MLGSTDIPLCSLINYDASLRQYGKAFSNGCKQKSINWEIFSVGLSQEETIGCIPIGCLWISIRK